jgi:hypothetical protein
MELPGGEDSPELTGGELASVLGWPQSVSPWSEPAPSGRRNRRSATRHAISGRACVRVGSAEHAAETVQLRNLSSGGFSALHARPLRPGDTFWITLRSPEDRAASLSRGIERRCRVLRCESGGTGRVMFSIAAQFIPA